MTAVLRDLEVLLKQPRPALRTAESNFGEASKVSHVSWYWIITSLTILGVVESRGFLLDKTRVDSLSEDSLGHRDQLNGWPIILVVL